MVGFADSALAVKGAAERTAAASVRATRTIL
jgi:hypothetical protein